MMAHQLAFDLPVRAALNRSDFLVTSSNSAAVAVIDQWPHWPSYAAAIVGPAGSGKTHLAHVFQQTSGAILAQVMDVTENRLPELLANGALAVELGHGENLDEKAFFHLLNLVRQNTTKILMTATTPPALWPVRIPDLKSRLQAIPVIRLEPPDDELLAGVVLKQFFDRQLVPAENVMPYLLTRMPRSLDSVRALVTEIDRQALAEKAAITRPFVAKVLARLHPISAECLGDS
jgi:chromosomal replication initiation ATPase DnaA